MSRRAPAAAPAPVPADYRPGTIVTSGPVAPGQLEELLARTRAEHGPMLQQFHEVYYNAGHTWTSTQFLGHGTMKTPNDLWTYQELIAFHRPRTIIETGTWTGASSLWYAFVLAALGIDGRVFTVDYRDQRKVTHPLVTFILGMSTDPKIAAMLAREIEYPLLVSLDADHTEAHVHAELELYAPLCRPLDFLVVEDTNIGWPGEGGDRGAQGAAERYLTAHQGEWKQEQIAERQLLTMHPGGWWRRYGACPHVAGPRFK